MNREYVFCGAGSVGRDAARKLRASGVQAPVCFADNDPIKWGLIDGIRVTSISNAISNYPTAIFVATADQDKGDDIYHQLGGLSVQRSRYSQLRYEYPEALFPSHDRKALAWIASHGSDLEEICNRLSDRESRIEFRGQIMWRWRLDSGDLPKSRNIEDLYFPPFIRHLSDEVFLDGGAYRGETTQEFIRRWSEFSLIWACEPDPENFTYLEAACTRADIRPLHCALSDVTGQIRLCALGTMSSTISADGRCVVEGRIIDDFSPPPTYIKLDVEGAEMSVLRGSVNTIKDVRPVLAICAYHRATDLWEIPQFLFGVCEKYRFYLRRYGEEDIDLVYYAVPEERVVV